MMITITDDMLDPILDEYIGDDLTTEDLQRGLSAFLEDQQSEADEHIRRETA